MFRLLRMPLVLGCATAVALTLSNAASAAEATLNLISAFPKTLTQNLALIKYVDEVNQKGKGVVQIRSVGGPEVTPVPEQIGSVQRGINHMWFGSISYFQGLIDESRVLLVSPYNAVEMRKAGATKILNEYFEAKPKLHYLAYFGSAFSFHIYLRKDPKRLAGGGVDLTGVRLRGGGIYNPVFQSVGASAVPIHTAEIYSALERGTVGGIGWANRGLVDHSWEKHLKYRIMPSFWQGDISIVVQLEKWNSLSSEAQKLLTDLAAKHEGIAHDFFMAGATEELDKMRAAGMKDIVLKGVHAAKYKDAANGALWKIIEGKVGAKTTADLKKTFMK
jgi:TRAP-type C4-dicarboxylate transport system substrate-binding protein